MGTVTAYNLNNVQAALGGSNPISMSEYYRGGTYVPSTRTVTVREPTSGAYFDLYVYSWQEASSLYWANVRITNYVGTGTTFTAGGFTYYRGTLMIADKSGFYYAVYRTYPSTVSINTGVPSSGAISISQLFGAQNP
jgi:hypothetical protein